MPHPETDDFAPQSTNWDEHKLPPGAYGPDPNVDPWPPHPSVHPRWQIFSLLIASTVLSCIALITAISFPVPVLVFGLVLLAFATWLMGTLLLLGRVTEPRWQRWRTKAPPAFVLALFSVFNFFLICGPGGLAILSTIGD